MEVKRSQGSCSRPQRGSRNTDAMLESLWKVYRHTVPTLLLKLFYVFETERGKLHRMPHRLQVLSECWPGGFANRLPVNTDGNQDIL